MRYRIVYEKRYHALDWCYEVQWNPNDTPQYYLQREIGWQPHDCYMTYWGAKIALRRLKKIKDYRVTKILYEE